MTWPWVAAAAVVSLFVLASAVGAWLRHVRRSSTRRVDEGGWPR